MSVDEFESARRRERGLKAQVFVNCRDGHGEGLDGPSLNSVFGIVRRLTDWRNLIWNYAVWYRRYSTSTPIRR